MKSIASIKTVDTIKNKSIKKKLHKPFHCAPEPQNLFHLDHLFLPSYIVDEMDKKKHSTVDGFLPSVALFHDMVSILHPSLLLSPWSTMWCFSAATESVLQRISAFLIGGDVSGEALPKTCQSQTECCTHAKCARLVLAVLKPLVQSLR